MEIPTEATPAVEAPVEAPVACGRHAHLRRVGGEEPEAARLVENAVRDHFDHFLADNMDRGKALLGAILFAAFDAFQIRLQQTSVGGVLPYQVFLMMPYVLSILALILVARRATYPKALMIPYQKGER